MLSQEIMKMEQENEALKEIVAKLKRTEEGKREPRTCEHCRFFYQHYIKIGYSTYAKTYCGHCVHGRVREKKPDKFCDYFEPGKGMMA